MKFKECIKDGYVFIRNGENKFEGEITGKNIISSDIIGDVNTKESLVDTCVIRGDFDLSEMMIVNSIVINKGETKVKLQNGHIFNSYVVVNGDCDKFKIDDSVLVDADKYNNVELDNSRNVNYYGEETTRAVVI